MYSLLYRRHLLKDQKNHWVIYLYNHYQRIKELIINHFFVILGNQEIQNLKDAVSLLTQQIGNIAGGTSQIKNKSSGSPQPINLTSESPARSMSPVREDTVYQPL